MQYTLHADRATASLPQHAALLAVNTGPNNCPKHRFAFVPRPSYSLIRISAIVYADWGRCEVAQWNRKCHAKQALLETQISDANRTIGDKAKE